MTWNEEPNLTEEQKQKALEHVKKPWKFTYPPIKITIFFNELFMRKIQRNLRRSPKMKFRTLKELEAGRAYDYDQVIELLYEVLVGMRNSPVARAEILVEKHGYSVDRTDEFPCYEKLREEYMKLKESQ